MKKRNEFKEIKIDYWQQDLEYLQRIEDELYMKNEEISEILDEIEVDIDERKMVWPDGERLSIMQTAKRIREETGIARDFVKSAVISWLEICYVPQGLDGSQMEIFEEKVSKWIKDANSK